MPIPHTLISNASITFKPIAAPAVTSRNAPPVGAVVIPVTTPATAITREAFLNSVNFDNRTARAIVPSSVDFSSGQTWVGIWPDPELEPLPEWVKDAQECSISFVDGKPMTGVFWRVVGRPEFANRHGLGAEFILWVKRNA